MNKEVIDVDFTEVNQDGTEKAQTAQEEKKEETKKEEKFTDRLVKFGKKVARPAATALVIGTVVYIGYRTIKGDQPKVLPDSIRSRVGGEINLTGIDPTDLTGEQQEQLEEIKGDLQDFVNDVNGETE